MTEKTITAPQEATTAPTGYLTKKELRRFLGGVGASTITDWMNKRDFPQPLRISQNMCIWRISDVVRWVETVAKA